MEIVQQNQLTSEKQYMAARLEAGGWGAFFVWVGFALLADVGWGVGLLGVGIITLAAQAARRFSGLEAEGFWLVVGGLFALGGIWELSSTTVSLVPVLLIAAGAVLLVSALTGATKFRPSG